jgi:hypothetical protein
MVLGGIFVIIMTGKFYDSQIITKTFTKWYLAIEISIAKPTVTSRLNSSCWPSR